MNIKKFFVLIMISLLFFSLTACGNSKANTKNQTSKKSALPAICLLYTSHIPRDQHRNLVFRLSVNSRLKAWWWGGGGGV
ncbi:hypothetical protein RJC21_11240, partial [Staphylococcus hominis]|nr:hypothetical protein [Staphylococcus hominis]